MTFLLKLLFLLGDLFFLNLSIQLSFYASTGLAWYETDLNKLYLVMFSNIGWFFLVLVSSPYNLGRGWTISKVINTQFAFVFIHSLIVLALVLFFHKSYTIAQILIIYILFIPFFFVWKILVVYLRRILVPNEILRNYVLVGRNKLSEEIRKYYLINYQEQFRFKGYFDFSDTLDDSIVRLRQFCSENEVHQIFYCESAPNETKLTQLIGFGLDSLIKVKVVTGELAHDQVIKLDNFDQLPGLDLATVPLDEDRNQFVKRAFDLCFSSFFLLLVFSWLYPLFAILIKLDSKGPVLFSQLRNGVGNVPFKCFKFRSMTFQRDADFVQATQNDPRITRVGKFLRKSSIDELPQFINVFLGNMSLIGPRPHPLKLNEEYASKIRILMSRHYVKPGITGLAQCMGYRGETRNLADMENRVRLDRYYIENWTFWLDIKIIFLTIVSLLRGSDKAY